MTPLSPLIYTLLLTGTLPAVSPSIVLHPLPEQRLALQLCFQGSAQTLRFELHIDSLGPGGETRSRQRGSLSLTDEQQCPVRLQLDNMNERELKVRLEWSLDGVEQPPFLHSLRPI